MLGNFLSRRFASRVAQSGSSNMTIPKRPLKKIRLGKARPAIYYQFDVKVELSDGSVIKRRSQFPKDEIRLIQDQRNNILWNKSRTDLVVVDANAGGSMDKFKQKYSSIFNVEDSKKGMGADAIEEEVAANIVDAAKETSEKTKSVKSGKITEDSKKDEPEVEHDAFGVDDYLSILDDESSQIKSGKLAVKQRQKKK
ncbi:hypothetical protein TPHA_0A02360 [Tetrapisispora phaffii CBS 4417]|uniref:Ribosomal protein bL31m N-terminal domain-containing protein n=1 Tax=Tetrapisispora phaffii (strain ATCC 24235 / CBS 4417 / NBRC 1672 / NRRL Y-8282 / UCD 70-5) TaxID=1071381 RepID=G8BN40_TETPH|nr:mitochondrial 54S ribosomal protein YmL36 TPHA_0A02360 [Tetrapisispora phaffii CBS 4417]CCE61318.1 hypothetical protein TPHA_0A02360 [Tetrapisispora phaffii CBS 4417]